MSWLGKLFGRQSGGSAVSPRRRSGAPEAVSIPTTSVAEHCERMEREAARTGNKHLARTAQRIRARLAP